MSEMIDEREKSASELRCLGELEIVDILIGRYETRLVTLRKQHCELTKEIEEYKTTKKIIDEVEAAENETLIEKDLTTMEKTDEVNIPKIGTSCDLTIEGALAERSYLRNHPKPKYGWTSGITHIIESRIISLNEMIAELVSAERNSKNGK